MSKDNREVSECGNGIIGYRRDEKGGYFSETCPKCNGTGEVTTDSGADVCEYTLCHKTNSGIKYYESDCGLDYESPDSKSKFCRGCGKPITIKWE